MRRLTDDIIFTVKLHFYEFHDMGEQNFSKDWDADSPFEEPVPAEKDTINCQSVALNSDFQRKPVLNFRRMKTKLGQSGS